MKVIGIIGSPRVGGNTEILVNECLDAIRSFGIETETIHLGKTPIEACDGCLTCDEKGMCHLDDGMNEINQRLSTADGLVIGTPARWRLLSGQLKVFFDRTNPLAVPRKLEGKIAGVIAVGQSKGKDALSIRTAAASILSYCEDNGIEVLHTVVAEDALNAGDINKNKEALLDCRSLGQSLAKRLL